MKKKKNKVALVATGDLPLSKYKCLECGRKFEVAPQPVKCPNDAGVVYCDESTSFIPATYPTHHRIQWLNFNDLMLRKERMVRDALTALMHEEQN